jgi:hypothetical protein
MGSLNLDIGPPGTPKKVLQRRVLRGIGKTILPDVCVEEEHSDSMVITDHPVEQNTGNAGFISDHAYRQPAEVTLTYGWSPTGDKGRASNFLNDMYAAILKAKDDRLLLEVNTTRRVYQNMLVQSVTLTTDRYTENALLCRIVCREVLIARTKDVPIAVAPQNLGNPQSGLPTVPAGVINPQTTSKDGVGQYLNAPPLPDFPPIGGGGS